MMIQEFADRALGFAAHKYTGAELYRIAHETRGGAVAFIAFVSKPRWAIRLREEHVVDCVNLIDWNIMVSQESPQVVDMVASLQLSVRNPEELTREITGMPVTCAATVVPQPVQVSTRWFGAGCYRRRDQCKTDFDLQVHSHALSEFFNYGSNELNLYATGNLLPLQF